ncbi:MAG: DUF255 domain-containing protein [Thiohalomonas sp.]|nr:DUF255 domain-containing protein [Thiohalomonas sp.]
MLKFVSIQTAFVICLLLLFFSAADAGSIIEQQGASSEQKLMLLNALKKKALKNKGADYKPRTEHLNADGSPKYTNRLILEESPYLIQHAHNPVNWYAWGTEAFAAAKRENKPIFLSIGYSTCHWCHVMERESFDNEKMAEYLNQHFITIKVDRERRPDVDKIYMSALMIVKGSGGWPMSSILTPEGKPFFSGTYFPPEQFLSVLQRATKVWQDEETQLREIAEKITLAVQNRQRSLKQAEHIGKERIQIAVINLLNRYDELQGGFSGAPKFPNETYLFLLLDTAIREQDQEVLPALKLTMSMMAQGGIYDQVGGGFHRYSTDNEWLVPHFEKMLYNQAHLARTYLQLFMITKDESYKRVVRQILDYVLRDMRADNNAFFSASDADSEGEEGKFFLWTVDELKDTLNPALAKLTIALFGVTKEGNFSEDPMQGALPEGKGGTTILNLPASIAEFAQVNKLELKQLYNDVDKIRETLYKKRQTRIAPSIDAKVVTAWNGMMITTFAKAGKEFYEEKYVDAAKRAGDFLWQTHHFQKESSTPVTDQPLQTQSGLFRSSLDGKPSVLATQADYAYLGQGYLALFDITENKKWLERSKQLMKEMIALFWDKEEGSFFMSAQVKDSEQEVVLFDRPKDIYDGAIPSANSVALEVLSQLYYRTGDDYYHGKAMALIASLSSIIKTSPASFSYFLMAVNQLNFGELSDVQYGSKGHVRLEKTDLSQKIIKNKQVVEAEVFFSIDKNWHINSRYPKDEDLVATSISIGKKAAQEWKIIKAEYPAGEDIKLTFNESPLSLYQNSAAIKVTLESIGKPGMTIPLEVRYQTCSDKICLAPESKTFYIFPEHRK